MIMTSTKTKASDPFDMPHEPPRAASPAPAQVRTNNCAGCGTAIPLRDKLCAICERKQNIKPGALRQTLWHWVLFVGSVTLLIMIGAWFQR